MLLTEHIINRTERLMVHSFGKQNRILVLALNSIYLLLSRVSMISSSLENRTVMFKGEAM